MDLWRVAAWLFVGQGLVYFLIGALTPVMMGRSGTGGILLFSARSDSAYFGGDTQDLQQRDPALVKLKELQFLAIAGLLVAIGVLAMSVAWFAVRVAQPWGLWTLVTAGALALGFWLLILSRYLRAGAPVGLGDVPPFMWVTTLLWAAGSVAGMLAVRATPS